MSDVVDGETDRIRSIESKQIVCDGGEEQSLEDASDDVEELAEEFREILRGPGRSAPDAALRPALAKLVDDQSRAVARMIVGFGSRRDLLEWLQSLTVRTLGELDDEWYPTAASRPNVVAAMLRGRPWGVSSGFSPRESKEIRRRIAASKVLPACHEAIRAFRWNAVERVDHLDESDESDAAPVNDPTEQRYPAMRPALRELQRSQEWALDELLDGFGSGDAILMWSSKVAEASYAMVDAETLEGAYHERPIREAMLGDVAAEEIAGVDPARYAAEVRLSWAAEYLLPAFNGAARAVASRSEEVQAGEPGDVTPLEYA
jgi:hypothetical protein